MTPPLMFREINRREFASGWFDYMKKKLVCQGKRAVDRESAPKENFGRGRFFS
jgi:hypothetical protein